MLCSVLWMGDLITRSRKRSKKISRIRVRIKEFRFFWQKNCYINSRKYNPGCSSRFRIFTSRIQRQRNHRTRILKTGCASGSGRICIILSDPGIDFLLLKSLKWLKVLLFWALKICWLLTWLSFKAGSRCRFCMAESDPNQNIKPYPDTDRHHNSKPYLGR